jgi:hypothetical protein
MKLGRTGWVPELVWTFWQRASLACVTIQTMDHPAFSIVTILTAVPAPFQSLNQRKCKVLSKYNIIFSQDGTSPPDPPQIRVVAYFPTFIHCGLEEP